VPCPFLGKPGPLDIFLRPPHSAPPPFSPHTQNIIQAPLSFPDVPVDPAARDFITQLLARDVVDRIGCRKGGADDVKQHLFFRDLGSWVQLVQKQVRAVRERVCLGLGVEVCVAAPVLVCCGAHILPCNSYQPLGCHPSRLSTTCHTLTRTATVVRTMRCRKTGQPLGGTNSNLRSHLE
jgi:hypothetical protein